MGKAADLRKPADLVPAMPKGVYTMSNDPLDNQIFAYARAADGSLSFLNSYSTAGAGTGAGLGNQNGLIFDQATNLFFVVNAKDNSISMLSLKMDGSLELQFKIPSGGVKPVSITHSGGVVYVVNAGDRFSPANISGFQVTGNTLMPINGSIKLLSIADPGPAQIQFTADGTVLVVTEKMTNKIDTFTVAGGVATGPMVQMSNGTTPYGFAFGATQKLIVSEAFAGAAGAGAASSYAIGTNGALTTVSSKVASGQTAPCWVAVAGTTAYVTNAQTNNITGYRVAADGTLTLLPGGVSGMTGMGPTDEEVTDNNEFLYVLNSKDHSFSIYAIATDGTLTKKPDFPGLPFFANGLVAR